METPTESKIPQKKSNILEAFKLTCPLTGELMENPVTAVDRFSYEEKAIRQRFQQGDFTSPTTRKALPIPENMPEPILAKNHILKQAIEYFKAEFAKLGINPEDADQAWLDQELHIFDFKQQLLNQCCHHLPTKAEPSDHKKLSSTGSALRTMKIVPPSIPQVLVAESKETEVKTVFNPQDLMRQAVAYYHLGQFSKSLPLLLQAAKLRQPGVYSILANIYSRGGGGVAQDQAKANLYSVFITYMDTPTFRMLEKDAKNPGILESLTAAHFRLNLPLNEPLQDYPSALVKYGKERCSAAEAWSYFKQAAQQSFTPAYYEIGMCYLKGTGTHQDIHGAIQFLQSAAEKGHILAILQLAEIYENGYKDKFDEIVPDMQLAIKHYTQAAELGSEVAQLRLCKLYCWGDKGQKSNIPLAMYWGFQGFAQGDVECQFMLGGCYRMPSPYKNTDKADYLQEQALHKGSTIAINSLELSCYKPENPDVTKSISLLNTFAKTYPEKSQQAQIASRALNLLAINPEFAQIIASVASAAPVGLPHSEEHQQSPDLALIEDEKNKRALNYIPNVDWATCPISLQLMRSPLINFYGQTFDSPALEKWLGTGNWTCPKTRKPLSDEMLITDLSLKGALAFLTVLTALQQQAVIVKTLETQVQKTQKNISEEKKAGCSLIPIPNKNTTRAATPSPVILASQSSKKSQGDDLSDSLSKEKPEKTSLSLPSRNS
ncbi:MAG TPA: U-box domain-containing protein [Gammaproteobacteria bacterium]|nr:U-box domain-containing protein [Gammaproteobacteria bacterium]